MQCVTLAESQILETAGELGLRVDQARGGARRATGENSGAKSYGNNNRCNFHKIFLSSNGVKQMKNKAKAWRRIDNGHEGQASQWRGRPEMPERIQNNQQSADENHPMDQRPQKPPSINSSTDERVQFRLAAGQWRVKGSDSSVSFQPLPIC